MYVQPWKRDRDRTQKITNQIPQSTMKYQIQRPMQSPKRYGQTCNDTHRYIGEVSRALIEEGTAARVASVRNCSPQGADESTRLDASDPDTGHGCERTVGVGRGVDGAGMIRLKGLRTSNSPGMPALYLFLCSQVIIPRLRNLYTCIGFQGQRRGCRRVLVILMRLSRNRHIYRIADEGALRVYRHYLLLVLNLSGCTLSNINLTVCVHYTATDASGWVEEVR